MIKRGLDRVLKPNETLKESFANPKFLLFRVLLQGCNFVLGDNPPGAHPPRDNPPGDTPPGAHPPRVHQPRYDHQMLASKAFGPPWAVAGRLVARVRFAQELLVFLMQESKL